MIAAPCPTQAGVRHPASEELELSTDDIGALTRRIERSFLGRCVRRFTDLQGIDRALGLASQAFTAMIPILILMTTFAPHGDQTLVADTIVHRFNLSGDSANAVYQLFAIPDSASSTASVFSVLLLLFSGVSFTRRMGRMYRTAYGRDKPGVRASVFAFFGLLAIVVEIGVVYLVRSVVRHLPLDWLVMIPLSFLAGAVLWTSIPWLLLNREVHWRRLVSAGVIAATGTSLYGAATAVYMPGLIERSINEYGLFGITFAILGWLLAICLVIVATAAIGAEFDVCRDPWAIRIKGRFMLYDPAVGLPPPRTPSPDAEGEEDVFENPFILGRIVLDLVILSAAFWVSAAVVPGIQVTGGVLTYLWVSLLFGIVNAVLGPILHFVAWPLTALTLGLFALVVNAILLMVTAGLSPQLQVGNFLGSLFGALVISVVTAVLNFVLSPIKHQVDTVAHLHESG